MIPWFSTHFTLFIKLFGTQFNEWVQSSKGMTAASSSVDAILREHRIVPPDFELNPNLGSREKQLEILDIFKADTICARLPEHLRVACDKYDFLPNLPGLHQVELLALHLVELGMNPWLGDEFLSQMFPSFLPGSFPPSSTAFLEILVGSLLHALSVEYTREWLSDRRSDLRRLRDDEARYQFCLREAQREGVALKVKARLGPGQDIPPSLLAGIAELLAQPHPGGVSPEDVAAMMRRVEAEDRRREGDPGAAAAEARAQGQWACERPGCGALGGGLRRCAGCGGVKYCSTECQRAHWRDHKTACRATQAQG